MRLRYTILWVDDRKDAIVPIEESVKAYLDSLGFELTTIYRPNGKNVKSAIKKHNIDLIAMDFNLGSKKGDALLASIRKNDKYIEAVLYSQDPGTIKDKGQGLDGIYRALRSDIKSVIKRVIDRTVRRSQDLHIVRGMVIAEAIDIENRVDAIIESTFKSKRKHFRTTITEKRFLGFGQKIDLLQSLLNAKIKRMRKDGASKLAETEDLSKKLKTISRDVLDPRNILAHSDACYDRDGNSILKGINSRTRQITPDATWCKTMRQKFQEHLANLDKIATAFK